jgi:hypothetical protein
MKGKKKKNGINEVNRIMFMQIIKKKSSAKQMFIY